MGLSWDDGRALLESIGDYALVMLDTDGYVATWNAGAASLHGWTSEEIVGQHFTKLFTQEDVEAGVPKRSLVRALEAGHIEEEGWRLRKDGSRFWASVTTTVLRDEHGNVRGYARVMRDLGPSHGAKEDLRVAEERFHHLVDAVSDYAIFLLDETGHVASWNPGVRKTKGYEPWEIIGKHFSVFYTPEDRAAGKPERILETVRREGRFEDESWRLRKDGTRFWANVVITAIRDEKGHVTGFAKVTRDLTERRDNERRLREAEERFHHLVDAVTDYAIFLLDPSGHVATWNAGARALKGYTPEEIIGKHLSVFYTEQDRIEGKPQRILDTVRRVGRCEDESWRVRKDGTRFWADVVITALRNDKGEVTGFAKITRDLTERRAAAEELRRSEERFRLLIEGVKDYAIYMLDPEGRVSTWNVGAERLKGYSAQEIMGQHFSLFFPEEDVRAGKPQRELEIAKERGRYEDEGFRKRKDGTLFWANVVVTPLRDAHGHLVGYAKVTRDLTTRREAERTERNLIREQAARAAAEASERSLRESEERARRAAQRAEDEARRAERATRAKDEFLATVSHELRTPLNAMMGFAALLMARARGETDAALIKAVEAIHRNAQAQARIIDDILDVSRIVTGKLRLEVKAVDLVDVCKEALDVVRASAAAKGVTLELEAKSNPALLVGDPERLRQVAWNLLSNAVKFTERGGTITTTVEQSGAKVTLTVQDTGRGIDPAFLPHVFERFQQADSSTTRKFGGLGLGLAIVRHIVELHGGQVDAQSEGKGKGALFRVTLPVRAIVEASEEAEVAHGPHRMPSHPGERPRPEVSLGDVRVLVVDDDDDARELVRTALEAVGAKVEVASSAKGALEVLRTFRPNILVSDVGMPDEDGYSLVGRVRQIPSSEGGGIPSIALTAYTRTEDRAKALSAGFTTHIGKPVDPNDLISAVANLAAFTHR